MLKVFEPISNYHKVVVTGSQRSGTTICSKMISHTFKLPLYDEVTFKAHNKVMFKNLLNKESFVIQAPGMFKECMSIKDDDVLVVVMKRDINDIIFSDMRIGWSSSGENKVELAKFGLKNLNLHSSVVKMDYFKTHKPKNYLIINYEDLKEHPLWVDKFNRQNFSAKQTEVK